MFYERRRTVLLVEDDPNDVVFSAEDATSYDIYLQGPGGGPFVLMAADYVGTNFIFTGLAPGEYQTRAVGKNSTGSGPEGEIASFTIA